MRTRPALRRAAGLVATALLAVGAASGCSGDAGDGVADEPSEAPSEAPSSGAVSAGGDATPSAPTDSPSPTESEPAVEGEPVALHGVDFVLPSFYVVQSKNGGSLIAYRADKAVSADTLLVTSTLLSSGDTLQELYDFYTRVTGLPDPMKRLPDVEVDGQPVFHVDQEQSQATRLETYGAAFGRHTVLFEFTFSQRTRRSTTDRVVADLLSTIDFET